MRAATRRLGHRLAAPPLVVGRAAWEARAELLTAAAFLAGWALLTHAAARLTTSLAWAISGGLLCLSLGGWRLLWAIVTQGLYVLTRTPGGPRG